MLTNFCKHCGQGFFTESLIRGFCTKRCKTAFNNRKSYSRRRSQILVTNSAYYQAHKEQIRIKKTASVDKNRLRNRDLVYRTSHSDYIRQSNNRYNTAHREKRRTAARERWKRDTANVKFINARSALKLKQEVLLYYSFNTESPMCCLCSEQRLHALTIDHIAGNGGGRKRSGGGAKMYSWLRRNNYPSGFRTLCANCNIKEHLKRLRLELTQNRDAEYARKRTAKWKALFMNRLGGQCSICDTTDIDILTCHHTNNNGATHRRSISNGGGGIEFYRKVIAADDFTGLECRCFNCNCAEEWTPTTPLGIPTLVLTR
jgi:hypothetical protein